MPNALTRLIYVDDSGHPQDGVAVFGWIEFSPDRWMSVLKHWLATRKMLWREHGVPVSQELHTVEYVNGRGRISQRVPDRHVHEGVEYWKDFGREVAVECLETVRSCEGLSVGAVHTRGEPAALAESKRRLYGALLSRFETELSAEGSLGMVFVDGDASDTSYRAAHRRLPLSSRRVIEDAIHLDSRTSQLVQMADLVAWAANAAEYGNAKNQFAHRWYADHLSERDPDREPQHIDLDGGNSKTP